MGGEWEEPLRFRLRRESDTKRAVATASKQSIARDAAAAVDDALQVHAIAGSVRDFIREALLRGDALPASTLERYAGIVAQGWPTVVAGEFDEGQPPTTTATTTASDEERQESQSDDDSDDVVVDVTAAAATRPDSGRRHLERYDNEMRRRRRQVQRLTARLEREPEQLLMNS